MRPALNGAVGAVAGGGRAVLPTWQRATPIKPVYEIRRLGASSKPPMQKRRLLIFSMMSTAADIRLAHQEGFVSVEHLKRYTTLGMAAIRGKWGM